MDERDLHYLKKETKLNGRYIITSVLGEGGFGITYYGVDDLFGNEVAIKEFFPQGIVTRNNEYTDNVTVTYAKQDEAFLAGKKRFIGEARVMAKFNGDQGIVNVTDFFEANNTAYIVMEYLDGITLKEYLKGNRQIPVDELMGLLAPLLESLDDVHQSGLIHRDISPDNIMVLKDGSVKLMDFGKKSFHRVKTGICTGRTVSEPGSTGTVDRYLCAVCDYLQMYHRKDAGRFDSKSDGR